MSVHAAALLGATGPLHESLVRSPATARDLEARSSGETFEVPVDDRTRPSGEARPADEVPAVAASGNDGAGSAPVRGEHAERPPRPRTTSAAAGSLGHGETRDGDRPSTFGAEGDRSAVDLAGAFTRAFPQAASADPLWLAAPFGSAGTADICLTIDSAGALVDARSTGAPGPALAAGVRRTVALIRARAFLAHGRETHLRVTATVTSDQVHDGLHGEVFAIGGSFDGAAGTGFFALAIGRRVDVRVQVVR